jgi:hypothetical protein
MRLVINLILAAIVVGLIWVLISSIREPIAFKAEKEKRERAVIDRLMEIRTTQEFYRDITGRFAPNFDTLNQVLRTGDFKIISVIGDPDDPNFTGVITYDTTYQPAIDTIRALKINLDSLRYVPYSNGVQFDIAADTTQYQSTTVNVVEVGTRRSNFMGRFSDRRFRRYDQAYDPNSVIKFGNLNAPNLSGNWE